MDGAGFGARSQFWAAVGTSVPQPIGAVVAFLLVERIEALLPFSLAFAAGAMLALVVVELVPAAWSANRLGAAAGTAIGAVVMAALAVVLAV
jgi:ZIP family zinc transporter